MQEWLTLLFALGTLVSATAAVLAWVAKLRWSDEYRSAHENIVKAKDAQIAQIQEEIKTKDATIESLKLLTYSDAEKHIAALKTLHEQRLSQLATERDELQSQNAQLTALVDQQKDDQQNQHQVKFYEALIQQLIVARLGQINSEISSTNTTIQTLDKFSPDFVFSAPDGTLFVAEVKHRVADPYVERGKA